MKKIKLKQALDIWAQSAPLHENHFLAERLFQLAMPNAMLTAEREEIHHLSLCTECLSTWKTLCDINDSLIPDDADDDTILSAGVLQAASSHIKTPVVINSECKQFCISIFPEIENPKRAMIVLETIGNQEHYNRRRVTIRDSKGHKILLSTIKKGRAATTTDELDSLDFSKITLTISGPTGKGINE
ncbi:MAG: hypothetical protein GY699_02795 [Desulfobacteraceae bacterium]|nr:hypothetical protein [Desulfobacteraceae bacterium]